MYVISIKHPSITGQHDVAGEDRVRCIRELKKMYPNEDYEIVWEGPK